jgi:formyltetrahydrofolate deformylase
MEHWRLLFSCPDQTGVVAAVSACVAKHHGLIVESHQHSDTINPWFFMRQDIRFPSHEAADSLKQDLDSIAKQFQGQYQCIDVACAKKVVVLVSGHLHCLNELLYRFSEENMPGQLQAVISNHQRAEKSCEHYEVPFYHCPIDSQDKEVGFARLALQLDQLQPDVIVLARYMQVLPAAICDVYPHKIINIHHSFLPSFSGGHAYRQAFERGVKLIGATSHYVTVALDQGPIIGQDVVRIGHADKVDDLKRLGYEVERRVLANALYQHLQDRVMVHANKTIVF